MIKTYKHESGRMGLSFSKSADLAEKEKQIQLEIGDWVALRNTTITELSRVADELDLLHKRATYSKIAGGVAGAVGGGIALGGLALSFFTGGASLFLTGTGLTIAAGGGVTATVAEVVEYLKKRTRVDAAQSALEQDKKVQAQLLAKIESTIDTSDIEAEHKSRVKTSLKAFVDGMQKLWVSGLRVYGWAKSGQAIYSTVKWAKAGNSIWKFGATQGLKRTIMSVGGGVAGSLFLLVDLGYVIHHAIQIQKGTPSDAAKNIRDICKILKEERDKIIAITHTH